MHLAKECGIVVPATHTLTVAGRDVFLIRRFGREGPDRRLRFVSAATLLGTADITAGIGMDDSRGATLGNALSVCAVFGLAVEEGRAIVQEMKQTSLSRWETVFIACSVPRKNFPALAEALVNHLRR